jgi:hypothetical protein
LFAVEPAGGRPPKSGRPTSARRAREAVDVLITEQTLE